MPPNIHSLSGNGASLPAKQRDVSRRVYASLPRSVQYLCHSWSEVVDAFEETFDVGWFEETFGALLSDGCEPGFVDSSGLDRAVFSEVVDDPFDK